MLIVTHSGKFHADDVWAVAVLDIVFQGCTLVRTRDPKKVMEADFAVDVGGIWDAPTGRFDHHQKGFSGARQSGVIYASAGLVWKEHGARCVEKIAEAHAGYMVTTEQAQQIAHAIDHDLVQYLDMSDTGAARNAPGGYGLSAVISGFNPTWIDEQQAENVTGSEELRLRQFRRAMELVKHIITNAVKYRVGSLRAVEQVRHAERLENGKLLFLKNGALPWSAVVRKEMPHVLFVISYDATEQRYMLHTVPATTETFEARKDLPASWAGLRDEGFAQVTGVPDAVFCHNALFIAAAKSYQGILKMARMALAENAREKPASKP
jgi:uncharacterized UPF0160 family protein